MLRYTEASPLNPEETDPSEYLRVTEINK